MRYACNVDSGYPILSTSPKEAVSDVKSRENWTTEPLLAPTTSSRPPRHLVTFTDPPITYANHP